MFRKLLNSALLVALALGCFALSGCDHQTEPSKAESIAHESAKPDADTHSTTNSRSIFKAMNLGSVPISVLPETSLDLGNGVTLVMVQIPAGEFMMGDDAGEKDEQPAHKVSITMPFYLGKYAITQQQWQAVMGNNPSHFKGENNPVEQIKWKDCQDFLDRLNAKAGGKGGKFVLPTEAQWEYACRAGSTTKFSFGDDKAELGDYAWFVGNAKHNPQPVGEKKPNAWGLYDMNGNVWQWCRDRYGPYDAKAAKDPTGPADGSSHVLRGASASNEAKFCESAFRYQLVGLRFISIGLRVAREAGDK